MQTPNRKVTVGAVAGAVASLLAWSAGEFAGVDLPAGIEAALATVATFTLSYFLKEKPNASNS